MLKTIATGILFLVLCACSKDKDLTVIDSVDIRSSTVVTMFHSDPIVKKWLENPDKAYFECHFLMPSGMAEDVTVGLDIEYGEGSGQAPLYFENSQWATITGVTRDGLLFFNRGTQSYLDGIPEDGNFAGVDLKTPILPEMWYRMRTEVDFKERKYLSVAIEGPNLDTIVDLGQTPIEFTMKIPFDKRNLTFYVLALRNSQLAEGKDGKTVAYFDKVEGGIWSNNDWTAIYQDGFENQSSFPDVTAAIPTVRVENFQEGFWYRENDDALVEISEVYAFEGSQSAACDARLK